MGNEHSNSIPGLELDEKAIEVTGFWTHHSATINSGNSISVFIGEPLVSGSLWVTQTPLEKATKNLMVYRHPCILKYISSWHKGSKFYLAVEDVKPLSIVLHSQNTMQICVGLHSLLKAICFLHDKALVSHNNICVSSIYVTKDGNWRLGGMEYLCRFIDLTEDYLCKTRAHRYDKAIDLNENKSGKDKRERPYTIDCYAFGVLVDEVLQKRTDEEISWLSSFRDICKNELQHPSISARPSLASLLEHQFFTHDFINVYSFLTELPLKSSENKYEFFLSLRDRLQLFNEVVVASQLGGLLLSRMVLLDKTAQHHLLPFVFCPRTGTEDTAHALFSTDNFKRYLVPRLLQIICVRDAQIRLLLLDHFIHYMKCFSIDELQSLILPELLVGIKDTNDHLVAITLRALADMVPILGAATVIGGKRAKLFNDGRPIVYSRRPRRNSRRAPDSIQTDSSSSQLILEENASSSMIQMNTELPERPSPDGEEGETSTEDVEPSVDDALDNWEDWDVNEAYLSSTNTLGTANSITSDHSTLVSATNNASRSENSDLENNLRALNLANAALAVGGTPASVGMESGENSPVPDSNSDVKFTYQKRKLLLPDIADLDIKNQRVASKKIDEYDFFRDMEPVIQAATISGLLLDSHNVANYEIHLPAKLDLSVIESEKHEEGWGDDCDWD